MKLEEALVYATPVINRIDGQHVYQVRQLGKDQVLLRWQIIDQQSGTASMGGRIWADSAGTLEALLYESGVYEPEGWVLVSKTSTPPVDNIPPHLSQDSDDACS